MRGEGGRRRRRREGVKQSDCSTGLGLDRRRSSIVLVYHSNFSHTSTPVSWLWYSFHCLWHKKSLFIYACIYVYTYTYVYIYINTFFFYSYSTFSHGATVSIPRTWYMAVPKKKRKIKKQYIGQDIYLFFPKIGIWHDDILLPSGGGKGQRFFFWVYIQVFSFFSGV